LWVSGDWWEPVHLVQNVARFERELGVQARRWAYNARCFAHVRRHGTILRGQHAGFFDLFVPVKDESGVRGVFVAGPFATERPTGAEILERWFSISGSRGRISDPAFALYLSTTLSTLTLAGNLYSTFEQLVETFAQLTSGHGDAALLARRAETLREKLQAARSDESMWDAARSLVDERTSQMWSSPDHWRERGGLGIAQVPEHVAVGLLLGKPVEPDPVEDQVRRDEFQRACVAFARRRGNVVCGQVGDHGVFFLLGDSGSPERTRARLVDLTARASALARRHGFKMRTGISAATSVPLPARYRAALVAAEMALSRDEPIVWSQPRPVQSRRDLRKLRMKLAQSIGEHQSRLFPRFDQYVEAVLLHSGYRLEPLRAELDAGLERLAEPLLATGSLDEKSFDDLCERMETAAENVSTVSGLVALYRSVISDIRSAIESPTRARQDRGTSRALAFMREHSREPITLSQVARVAGFAPDYFSRIFRRAEGVTFERHLQRLRIDNAKRMLRGTELGIDGVSRLSGFANRGYFHRVFKSVVGVTPWEYRSLPT
jgi:AraC-like DNA-binding protein